MAVKSREELLKVLEGMQSR
jgi:hypothetical protein